MTRVSLTWLKAAAGVWFLRNKRWVTSSTLTLFLAASIGLGGYYSTQPQTTVFDSHQQNGGSLQPGEPTNTPGTLTTKPQAIVEEPSNESTQQNNVSQNDPSEQQSSDSADPLRIGAVQLNGVSVVCQEDGSTRVRISSATVTLNTAHAGGTLRWQWEIEGRPQGMENPQSEFSATSETIAENTATYTINPTDSDFLYSNNGYPIQNYNIRLKTVAPNQVASSWLAVPAGVAQCTP